ncbi:hypothetical protein B0H13DRAFT_1987146 [Mycena leptocephala]|nr:hypothetical protein B0H13DRAFT_1987146 [Mycena leptocephala]
MDPSDSDSDIVALDGPTNYADNDVDGMILATARTHPEATRNITYYINIPKPPPLTTRSVARRRQTMIAFKKDLFPSLLLNPTLLSCLPWLPNFPVAKRTSTNQKYLETEKTKEREKLPLGKNTGYQAMVTEMEGKAPEGRVVLLFMPPPTKPMEEATPWETNDEPVPSFDYTQLEPTGAADSVAQQKEHTKLEEKYTIGNYPNFPDRRLNALRLGIWASAMAQGTTDENKPPTSKFFDANQCIKTIPSVAVPAPAPAVLAPPALPALPAPAPASNPVPHLRSTPPSPVKHHTVPLDRFCEIYALDAADVALLKSVGFRPGDHTGPTMVTHYGEGTAW